MANKNSKKGGFTLQPITLSEPVKTTDGFTNLVETGAAKDDPVKSVAEEDSHSVEPAELLAEREVPAFDNMTQEEERTNSAEIRQNDQTIGEQSENGEKQTEDYSLSQNELLRILGADSLDEIYEVSDVLRASSLKLYATLVQLADSRGRARAKNHELMAKAGIKGIATLYKQERWLMELKLLEKKAKPGPHDGSSYVVHPLETLPLPVEIIDKFQNYLSGFKQIN